MGKGLFIQTFSGIPYYPADPHPSDVLIEDIAHALANLCRYTGHSNKFFSVAEHSILVSEMVPSQFALEGLLHDASEAYCIDVPYPLKMMLPQYRKWEKLNDVCIRKRFGLPLKESVDVRLADKEVLRYEKLALMRPTTDWCLNSVQGFLAVEIQCYAPESAKLRFLARFEELGGMYAT